MYYLLENNKIYDTQIPYHKNYPYWQEENGKLICVTKNGRTCKPCKNNKIIKSSDNKYNLIAKGDLIIGNECAEYEDFAYIVTSNFDNIDDDEIENNTSIIEKMEKKFMRVKRLFVR